MRKTSTIRSISVFFLLITLAVKASATVFIVTVANFAFSPNAIPNVMVGDTIRWVWSSGFHDTTSDSSLAPGTTRPAGAAPWSSPMTSPANTFDYKVAVAGTYNYICTIHPTAMKASFTASNPLPVKLTEFKVVSDDNTAVLNWITASENNIDYFSVQKSETGSDFVEIARVPAAGNSSEIKSYKYADINSSLSPKYCYYTIGIVDKEGNKEFSPVALFRNGKLNISKLIISLSPNPIERSGHLMLKFNADKMSKMNVKVVDMQGKTFMETSMQAIEGVNNGHLMLDNISSGTYTVNFELNGIKEVYKLVVR